MPDSEEVKIEKSPQPRQFDLSGGSARINWMYPGIYSSEKRSVLEVYMYSVRASGSLEIEFDGPRNEWVIYRTVCIGHDGAGEMLEKRKEVASLPAFDEEEADDW